MKTIAKLTLALFLFAAPAQAETKAPMKAGPISGIFSSLLQKLQNITLADLQAADALALSHGNQISHTCFQAWISFLQAEKQALNGPDGKPVQLPTPHLIYDAERILDLLQALQPTNALSVACAPLKGVATSITVPLPLP